MLAILNWRMRKNRNIILLFSIFLKFLDIEASILKNSIVPTTTENIEFELEVTDTLKVDPVYLDFGNILRNSKNKKTSVAYFNLSSSYDQNMLVSTSYLDGSIEGEYTKIKVLKKENPDVGDFLDVYLYNLKSQNLNAGSHKIPIMGEIREVGNIALGEYEKTITMEVEINPF